jgi:hypothetical protein
MDGAAIDWDAVYDACSAAARGGVVELFAPLSPVDTRDHIREAASTSPRPGCRGVL